MDVLGEDVQSVVVTPKDSSQKEKKTINMLPQTQVQRSSVRFTSEPKLYTVGVYVCVCIRIQSADFRMIIIASSLAC